MASSSSFVPDFRRLRRRRPPPPPCRSAPTLPCRPSLSLRPPSRRSPPHSLPHPPPTNPMP